MAKQTLTGQVQELRQVWDALIEIQPRLHATMPADIARARSRLEEIHAETTGKAPHEERLFLLYRMGLLLGDQTDALSMGQIGEALGVPLSTATRLVDWLVESGYVERLPHPSDRRVVRVALTESGSRLYATFNEYFNRRVEQFLRHFTPDEREQLVAMARKTVHVLRVMSP